MAFDSSGRIVCDNEGVNERAIMNKEMITKYLFVIKYSFEANRSYKIIRYWQDQSNSIYLRIHTTTTIPTRLNNFVGQAGTYESFIPQVGKKTIMSITTN